jgi:hypothetical protein
MPSANTIQFSTASFANSIKIGNAVLGINDAGYGPTTTTGFWNGITPPSGGYTIYVSRSIAGPNIYTPSSDSELITYSSKLTNVPFTSVSGTLAWFATQSSSIVVNKNYPNIVVSGSNLILDASFIPSYPTTQSTWYDLSGQGSNGSLINGPTFDPNGWLTFDGIDDYISIPNAYSFTTGNGTDYTFEIWFKMRTLPTIQYGPNGHVWGGQNGNNVVIYLNPQSGGVSKGIMIYDDTRYDPSMMTNGGFTTDTWAQWVIIGDGTNNTVTHYINGALDRGPTVVQPSSQYVRAWGYGQTKFGFDTRWNTYSTLDLAIARQYTRQLSPTEISQNYYQAPIVTDGLVFAVDAGNLVSYESGSTTTYSLTGSASGSLINGVGYSSGNGGSWNFDGVDDRIQSFNFTALGFDVPWTFGCWFNTTATHAVNVGIITLSFFPNLMMAPSGIVYLWNSIGTAPNTGFSYPTLPSTNTYNDGNWHHIVGSYNTGGLAKLYVDGKLINSASYAPNGVRAIYSGVDLGEERNNGFRYFNGKITSGFVYNRELSASEILQNFNAQRTRFGV